ncbi:GntR family transcriptional regulator [Nonomuraea angiospora]|uniref:GntR family transcriptional regulator n=1 Tax=Nonomuraea angiospora TaxID=46172 RepID=UPI0033D0A65D
MSSASNESLYREVARKLRDKIRDGVYPLGEKIPTEVELAEELGVNRVLVNRALRVLRAEGWVRTHRGVGTFVRDFMPITRETPRRFNRARREQGGARGAFAGELAEQDLGYETRTVVERVRPPQHVADVLGVSAEEISVVMRARYMSVKAPAGRTVPYQIAITYVPLEIAEGTAIEEEDTGIGGLSSRLADLDQAQAELDDTIEVRPPEPEEEFLGLNEDQRVFDIFHIGETRDGRPVKVTTFVIPTHLSKLRYRVQLKD